MSSPRLFMLLIGCKPAGRHIEQHDILFCIGPSLGSLIPDINASWQGAGKIHIDAWREVNEVDGYEVTVVNRHEAPDQKQPEGLYFLNLGGYKEGEFEEFHYKMLVVAKEKSEAMKEAKKTAFYKHTGFKGAESHIDDKYGIDVDDIYEITDILSVQNREKYVLQIKAADNIATDEWHLGYTVLSKIAGKEK